MDRCFNMLKDPNYTLMTNNTKTSLLTFIHSHWGLQRLFPYTKKLHLLAEILPSSLQFIDEVAIIFIQNAMKLLHHL